MCNLSGKTRNVTAVRVRPAALFVRIFPSVTNAGERTLIVIVHVHRRHHRVEVAQEAVTHGLRSH